MNGEESEQGYAGRVRAARAYAAITQEQLAAQVGVDKQTVKRWEGGSYAPDPGRRLAIAAVCGVPADFLESGFGELTDDAIVSVRGWVSDQIAALHEDEGDAAAPPPTAEQGRDQGPAGLPRPRAESRRRS